MHWRHLGDTRAKTSAVECLDQLPKKYWVQCFNDDEKHWGDMTTNLFELVNSMFKSTRHLLVSSFVEEMYIKTTKLFATKGSTNPSNDQLWLAVL